jgi:hypothetical protein
MTRRLTVAAAALLALPVVAVWTQDAGAFTTAKRLCVSNARRTLKNTLSTTKLQAQSQYQASLRACFNDPGNGCVQQCFNNETTCQLGTAQSPGPQTQKNTCSTTIDPNDGVTSCVEQFDIDQAKCCLKTADASTQACTITPTGNFDTDAAAQLACAENARLARFSCSQACAAKYQQALDGCTTTFNDCLEGCG